MPGFSEERAQQSHLPSKASSDFPHQMVLLLCNLSFYYSVIAFSQCGFVFSCYSLFHVLILLQLQAT